SKILVKALESAAGQDYDPSRFEVILVNNAPSEDLSGVARQVEERFFKGGPGRVRYLLCPIKGLSSARNAGISEAGGEVVCFLDDDAVASPRWLKELERAYEDEKAGVVGGKILLQVPESAASWVEPAIYPYWSHFEPGFKEIHWAQDWPEYPWGANWTARRTALLRVGGFRASYGRMGKDFSGGEEQVAAILAAKLGYKVGLIPEGEVRHFVEESRFTKKHLKKTVQAGRLVNYRFQRDLYVPRWMTPGFQLKQIKNLSKKLVRSKGIPPTERMLLRFLLSAEVRVLRTILWDIWKRVSLPRRLD
ncbi:MAG TPA: glycosyltransferase, partial [Planctomycetes bacterium]|nr:glycosyltransferase [Planctomycetota bacterium]